mgnify:CR=1 FL=1
MDKWILSKLNSAVKSVDNMLANYKITEATRVLEDFVDQLSNWYVRRSRERFWVKDMPEDKVNAYLTLYTALVTIAKTAAPIVEAYKANNNCGYIYVVETDAGKVVVGVNAFGVAKAIDLEGNDVTATATDACVWFNYKENADVTDAFAGTFIMMFGNTLTSVPPIEELHTSQETLLSITHHFRFL